MTWVCIPSTCLLASEEPSSPTSARATLQSVLSKSKNIPDEFSCNDSLTEFYQSFPFGMTLPLSDTTISNVENSFDVPSESENNSSLREDSPVKTSPVRERGKVSKARKAASGPNLRESYAKYDHNTCEWKTHQCSLLGGFIALSETWQRWGMMRNGLLYPLPMPSGLKEIRASITNAKECGFLLRVPTPNVPNGGRAVPRDAIWTSNCTAYRANGKKTQVDLNAYVQRFPTLHGFSKDGRSNGPSGNELGRAVNRTLRVPTLQESDSDSWSYRTAKERTDAGHFVRLGNLIEDEDGKPAGGSLNPEWVEWLHGFPIGWTSIEPINPENISMWKSHTQWWASEPIGIPRVLRCVRHCSKRIAGLGNAQVPKQAEMAWSILESTT